MVTVKFISIYVLVLLDFIFNHLTSSVSKSMYLHSGSLSPYKYFFFSFFDLYHLDSLEINLLTETVPKIPLTPFICIASIVKFHSGILSHMVVLNSKTVHKVLANLCWLKLDLKDDQSNEKCRLSKYSSKKLPFEVIECLLTTLMFPKCT